MPDSSSPTFAATPGPATKPTWLQTLKVYSEPASLRMLSLGFSAGLPPALVFGTLSFWLREVGIDRTTIGFLSWVGAAYAFKWLWAPLVDRLRIPLLTSAIGQRLSWLFSAQIFIIAAMFYMGLCDPNMRLWPVVLGALALAFGSATLDIALDAFRIESADADKQPALSAAYQTGYRLAMIWSSAGALWVASQSALLGTAGLVTAYPPNSWQTAYWVMALSMLPGLLTVLYAKEPLLVPACTSPSHGKWSLTSLFAPLVDFFLRYRWRAVLVLALVSTYRISDEVLGVMANTFYVDMGFSKEEVAKVTKLFGTCMTLLGVFTGGALSLRFGLAKVLMLGAVLSATSNLLFAWLSTRGHDVMGLTLAVSADNLAGGIASAAFVGYLSSLTSVGYTATQYALLTSFMVLLPKFLGGFSGKYVDAFGYANFFTATALIGVPVLFLVALAVRVQARRPKN